MSTFDSDDLEVTGYFLPEDSQLRLKQLREYVTFLANLARPRRPDEDQEWTAEIRVGEVAICLELMAEQIEIVLDELSWPAKRGERAAAPEVKAESEVEPKLAAATAAADTDDAKPDLAADEPGDPYVAGVTLGQIDELARLGDILRAHGEKRGQVHFSNVSSGFGGRPRGRTLTARWVSASICWRKRSLPQARCCWVCWRKAMSCGSSRCSRISSR